MGCSVGTAAAHMWAAPCCIVAIVLLALQHPGCVLVSQGCLPLRLRSRACALLPIHSGQTAIHLHPVLASFGLYPLVLLQLHLLAMMPVLRVQLGQEHQAHCFPQ